MNLKSKLVVAFAVSALCIIGFVLISLLISDHKILQFDSSIISAVQGMESPGLTSIMKLFTFIGSSPMVILLSLIILFFLYKMLHHRRELILFIAVLAGSVILNELLKHLFHRARPHLHRLISVTGYSFPSGHAMTAFTLYGIFAFLLWRHISTRLGRSLLILFSIFMILMIGISRIYLGVHYPSDIVGGYLASGFWLTASIWTFQLYQERRYKNKSNLRL